MQRASLTIFLACLALTLSAQDEGISVNFSGASPSISDFAWAFLNYCDNDEEGDKPTNAILHAWTRLREGRSLDADETLEIDNKNGFLLYESRSDYTRRMEMCYWNEADGKHKLFAFNNMATTDENGELVLTETNDITFWRYSNATRKMHYCHAPGFNVDYSGSTYALPLAGKDITVTRTHDDGTQSTATLKWGGRWFDPEDNDPGKVYLERFYSEAEQCGYEESFVRRHVTKRAEKILADWYDYDCESGVCLAVWMLYRGDELNDTPGRLRGITVERAGTDVYDVTVEYQGDDRDGGYRYRLRVGLAKAAGTYKIDNIEAVEARSTSAAENWVADDEHLQVWTEGEQPIISDFVTVILSQEDLGEQLGDVADNWVRYRRGEDVHSKARLNVDERNGYVHYEISWVPAETNYTDFCYWNCSDGRHKLVACYCGAVQNNRQFDGQYTGLSFYLYDSETHRLTRVYDDTLGAEILADSFVAYQLPKTGRDIVATIQGAKPVKVLLRWDGNGFERE